MNQNWNYVPFGDVFNWKGKSKIKSGDGTNTGKYKMFVCSDIEIKRYDEFLEHEESIVFGTGGKASCHYVNEPFAYSTDCIVAQSKSDEVYVKFYYYFLRKNNLGEIQKTFTGSGLQHTSKKKIESLQIPVCDLTEQQRIVTKIEDLFSKLDKGVEELNKIKEQLKIYRQAVLKKVFDDITAKKTIKELSRMVTSGSRGWAKYYSDKGARFVRITDMTRDGIELKSNAMQFLDLPESVEGRRSKLQCNDILVSITADLGSIAIVPSNIGEAYINQHIAVIRFTNFNQGKFMAWYLKSEHGQKELLKNKRGAGKLGLGLDDIRNTHVPDVDDSTANMILDEIEQKLSVCDKIEQTVNESLQKAESLRQSILKQAFEGKL
ncbi:MAG: restriction endonuclease subunit S, partial [Ruminococcaceae bacterium]|nr:restriction endonuclease subunit S [Oscillospiraceae bacterium]